MLRKNSKAQSTLEYIIALTAIVGVILYAAATWIKPAVQQTITDSDTALNNTANQFTTKVITETKRE